jgi:hypothetical protein
MMRRLQDQFSPFVRFLLGGQALVTWYNAITNPDATLFIVASTPDGNIILWAMGLLGATMLLDLFVNDWTPDKFSIGRCTLQLNWRRSWVHRHWLFVGIAACYAAQPHLAEMAGQSVAVTLVCYWNSLTHMVAAFIDAGERSRRLWWAKTCS